ncbi:MAG: DsrE family protein [Nitrospirota bacterium]|nr:DsrE family protein [Nitrospirota bacterium]
MESVTIILRRPPYGTVDAPEAIRHALGGITDDMSVKLVLLDGGVHAARKRQDTSGTEYLSAEEGITDCIDMGVEVYADRMSLKEEHLEPDDIIEGIIVTGGDGIAEIIREPGLVMIF